VIHIDTGDKWFFEISDWVNDSSELFNFLNWLKHTQARMVGFNNLAYDYTLLHHFLTLSGHVNATIMYDLSYRWFNGEIKSPWPNDIMIPQLDLFKIHHFDNKSKMVSLKVLEFNMRSDTIKDLPFKPDTRLTLDQAKLMRIYNEHDVTETIKFYNFSIPQIEFRDKLSVAQNKNFTNYNDTKIGEQYMIDYLINEGVNVNKHSTSYRECVAVKDIILPYVTFTHPALNLVLDEFKTKVFDKKDATGGLLLRSELNIETCINGFQLNMGSGGIHGSINREIVTDSDTHVLLDWDVVSFYPNLSIRNNLYPEHLGFRFCDVYLKLYEHRKSFPKSAPENGMLKLALNSIYGNSNSIYSPFYDPKYTLSITINGQLLLCMLAEKLMLTPDLKMIQINTDGLTFLCPKRYLNYINDVWIWWQDLTKLELESNEYSMMAVRDVNNYIALKKDGKVKRIGCYAYTTPVENPATRERPWYKDHSALVIPKAAEAAIVNNINISEFILNHRDKYDFMLRAKIPRSSSLVLCESQYWDGKFIGDKKSVLQNVTRYVVSKTGGRLIKLMPNTLKQCLAWEEGGHYCHEVTGDYKVVRKGKKPPSNKYKPVKTKLKMTPREIGLQVGALVKECNDVNCFSWENLDYDYYIKEAHKIVDCLFD